LGVPIKEKFLIACGVVGALILVYGLILSIFGSTIGIWVVALGLLIVVLAIILYVNETDPMPESPWKLGTPM
jgi:hypothetical protein